MEPQTQTRPNQRKVADAFTWYGFITGQDTPQGHRESLFALNWFVHLTGQALPPRLTNALRGYYAPDEFDPECRGR